LEKKHGDDKKKTNRKKSQRRMEMTGPALSRNVTIGAGGRGLKGKG